jgi:hypothetical protein
MSAETPKRLRMFAGPNESGKTSLVRKLAREFSPDGLFQLHNFINADDLDRDLHEGRGILLDFSERAGCGGHSGWAHSFLFPAAIALV